MSLIKHGVHDNVTLKSVITLSNLHHVLRGIFTLSLRIVKIF
jgi:hypothetical protein